MGGVKIREQDPLKQGLKQILSFKVYISDTNSRARSIKTRIETMIRLLHALCN